MQQGDLVSEAETVASTLNLAQVPERHEALVSANNPLKAFVSRRGTPAGPNVRAGSDFQGIISISTANGLDQAQIHLTCVFYGLSQENTTAQAATRACGRRRVRLLGRVTCGLGYGPCHSPVSS